MTDAWPASTQLATLAAGLAGLGLWALAREAGGWALGALQIALLRRRRWRTSPAEAGSRRPGWRAAAGPRSALGLASVGGGALLAGPLAAGQPVLAAFVLAVALGVAGYAEWRARRRRPHALASQVERFLGVFLPLYEARPGAGVQAALRAAVGSAGPALRPGLEEVVLAIEIGRSPQQVYAQHLRRAGDPYLAALLAPLARAHQADAAVVSRALRRLALRLVRRRRLQDRTRVALALLKGSLRFLQLANVVVLGVILLGPDVRAWYLQSPQRQLMLAALVGVVAAAATFFDHQLASMEEQVL